MTTDTTDASDLAVGAIGAIAGIAVLAIATAMVVAIVLMDGVAVWLLWGWFVVPHGMPAINIPMAIGIGILCGTLSNSAYVPKGWSQAPPAERRNEARFCNSRRLHRQAVLVRFHAR